MCCSKQESERIRRLFCDVAVEGVSFIKFIAQYTSKYKQEKMIQTLNKKPDGFMFAEQEGEVCLIRF